MSCREHLTSQKGVMHHVGGGRGGEESKLLGVRDELFSCTNHEFLDLKQLRKVLLSGLTFKVKN